MTSLGYWREFLPGLATGGAITWRKPGPLGLKVWIGLLGGLQVARINRLAGHRTGCSASLDGWIWTTNQPGSAAQRLGVQETPVRGFTSVLQAKKAIKEALGAHKACEHHQPLIGGPENASRNCIQKTD